MTETFDYIVVGGGSSGCVVAARLVAEKHARVLLLEAGHSHRHPLLDMPPGIFKMIKGSKFMTYHKTSPQGPCHENLSLAARIFADRIGSCRGSGSPRPEGFPSEDAERAAGGEMALEVEDPMRRW